MKETKNKRDSEQDDWRTADDNSDHSPEIVRFARVFHDSRGNDQVGLRGSSTCLSCSIEAASLPDAVILQYQAQPRFDSLQARHNSPAPCQLTSEYRV